MLSLYIFYTAACQTVVCSIWPPTWSQEAHMDNNVTPSRVADK
jgi:hypothetical protein